RRPSDLVDQREFFFDWPVFSFFENQFVQHASLLIDPQLFKTMDGIHSSSGSVRPAPSSVFRPLASVFWLPASVLRPPSSGLWSPSSVFRPLASVFRLPSSGCLTPAASLPPPRCSNNRGTRSGASGQSTLPIVTGKE